MDEVDVTLEHLLSVADGGTGNLSNLALAHRECNELAADLPVMGKIKMRESIRAGLNTINPGQSKGKTRCK